MVRTLALLALAAGGLGVLFWVLGSDTGSRERPVPAVGADSPSMSRRESLVALASAPQARDAFAPAPPPPGVEGETSSRAEFAGLLLTVVSRETRLPLQGIRVQAHVDGIPEERELRFGTSNQGSEYEIPITDETGSAVLSLPIGKKILLDAWDERGGALRTRGEIVALKALEERRFELPISTERDCLVSGMLMGKEEPIPFQEVLLRQDGFTLERTQTDAFGSFSFLTDSWRGPYLRIEAPGNTAALVRPEMRSSAQEACDGFELEEGTLSRLAAVGIVPRAPLGGERIELERSATLRLTVHEGSNPAFGITAIASTTAQALIHLRGYGGWSCPEEFRWSGITEAHGTCVLDNLPAEVPIALALEGPGRQRYAPVTLEPGEKRDLDLDLAAPTELRGRIVDQHGQPLADQRIRLRTIVEEGLGLGMVWRERLERFATTDEEGAFLFERVYEGDYSIGPSLEKRADGRQIAPKTVSTHVQVDEPKEILLQVDCDLFLRGVVIEEHDWKMRKVLLTATPAGSDQAAAETMSEPDGRFEIGPLEHGMYELRASLAIQWLHESPVLVAPAGTEDLLVRISIPLPEGRIAGFVRDDTGKALEATVVLVEGTGDWTAFDQALPQAIGWIAQVQQNGARSWEWLSSPSWSANRTPGAYSVVAGTSSDLVSGAFHFEEILPGDYTILAATKQGYGLQQVSLTSRRGRVDGVQVLLHDGAELAVELPWFDGREVGAQDEWRLVLRDRRRNEIVFDRTFSGSEALLQVPAGRFRAELAHLPTGGSAWEWVQLENGARAEVRFYPR